MPRNVYWELFYHLVWRTKESRPMLTSQVEVITHKYLVHRALMTEGGNTTVHAVGGTDDHVHMAVSIPPTVLLSKWICDLKSATSHHVNHSGCGPHALEWQTGYGIVSFGKADLPCVVDYVRNQRAHHAAGRAHERLERITHDDDGAPGTAGG